MANDEKNKTNKYVGSGISNIKNNGFNPSSYAIPVQILSVLNNTTQIYKPKYLETIMSSLELQTVFSDYKSMNPITPLITDLQLPIYRKESKILKDKKDNSENIIENLLEEIIKLKENNEDTQNKVDILKKEINKHKEISENINLLNKVGDKAKTHIIKDLSFRNMFIGNNKIKSAIISVDIRKSTELMLLANCPEDFAEFISELLQNFERIVKDNFGVFDKFTGDGFLAFFPDFYSGTDSIYFALLVAKLCHKTFLKVYENHLDSFDSIKDDVGLGIGIDYGDICFTTISHDLTAVGKPVVYACRFAGAPAGHTYMNHKAMSRIKELYSVYSHIENVSIDIKHQGVTRGYEIELDFDEIQVNLPDWYKNEYQNKENVTS